MKHRTDARHRDRPGARFAGPRGRWRFSSVLMASEAVQLMLVRQLDGEHLFEIDTERRGQWGGAQRLSEEPYPFTDIWPSLLRVVDAFGVERLMFASDWTVCRNMHTYAEAVFYLSETGQLSERDKREIFSGTARRLLRIGGP